MKKVILILSIITLLSFKMTNGQIVLEHVYDSTSVGGNFYITDLGNNNSKYVFIDTTSNSFSIYNLDGSAYLLNISTPEPILPDFTVAYITSSLFDCDSTNIEYAFMSYQNAAKPFRVMRTDGTVLLHVDSARGPVCYGCVAGTKEIVPIVNTQEGAKLFLMQLNWTTYIRKTLVYGLCGTLPNTTDIFDFPPLNNSSVKLYPNPTSESITFETNLPNNLQNFELIIYDNNSKELMRNKIAQPNQNFILNVKELNTGTYYYRLTSQQQSFNSGKFILTK